MLILDESNHIGGRSDEGDVTMLQELVPSKNRARTIVVPSCMSSFSATDWLGEFLARPVRR